MKSEGTPLLPTASTSKPGTIFVKKDGGPSYRTPKTPTPQEHPKPKATYCGARPAMPPALNLFEDESRTSSTKTTSGKHPVYSLSSQGRPSSEDVAELEKPLTKVVLLPSIHSLCF
jgi:hypothetical protein